MVEQVAVLANELNLAAKGVAAVVALLADKNTVPFIARYRKEATGGLDEVQIRAIEERRAYLSELEDRRAAIAVSIEEQGKRTPELRAHIDACSTKAELEDLYLPYKRQRRTRGMIARERGLEPLADRILAQPTSSNPVTEAAAFVDPPKYVADVDVALAGARDIVAEIVAENATVRAAARQIFAERGELVSKAVPKNTKQPTKFEQYYDFREPVKTIPSHRFVAIMRGERDKVLRAHVEVDSTRLTRGIERTMGLVASSPFAAQLAEAIRDGYKRLLAPSVENDVRAELKLRSDRDAVDVFADNLRNLLLAAPLGSKAVIGIDPGLRTGCKCVAVDQTGKFLDNITIYLAGANHSAAARDFAGFVKKHRPVTIAVGNGTGGRETELFVRKLLRDIGVLDLFVVQVNEAGASVYSASDVVREEFPELDLTVRRRHFNRSATARPVGRAGQDRPQGHRCRSVSTRCTSATVAKKAHRGRGKLRQPCRCRSQHRQCAATVLCGGHRLFHSKEDHRPPRKNGAFASRKQLLEVSVLGPRAFEQAAGFLRIHGGGHPLDASAVHPERYRLVARMAADLNVEMADLVGDSTLARRIDITCYAGEGVGEPTLRDIVAELDKPGRDPREEFEPPKFRDDVNSLEDLQEGMQLEGVVTNVTAFGAFVDVGVHQDGLVHVSQLADRFVKDPKDVVKVGDRLSVRVLEIDLVRGRISLSARKEEGSRSGNDKSRGETDRPKRRERSSKSEGYRNNPVAALRDREK